MITNANYEPRTLLVPFEQGPVAHTFLRDTFFRNRIYPATNLIEFDFMRGRRRMAPFVAPLIGGKVMERQGFETRTYRAPRIAPVRVLRTPDLEARMPGETIYNAGTPADRAAEILAEDNIYLDTAISRREEWMCREVLVNGSITVEADRGYVNVINFLEGADAATGNEETVGTLWSANGSDPFEDLELARRETIKISGISPNVALFGAAAKKAFMNNAAVSNFLDKFKFQIATIEPRIIDDAVTIFGEQAGIQYYDYSEYFEDDAGTLFPMLPDESVLLLSTNVQNKIVYGAFTQLEDVKTKRFVTYQVPRIPFVYGDEEDGQLFYRITSCPLPMPTDILGIRKLNVVAPAGGAGPRTAKRPVFKTPKAGPPPKGERED